MHNRIVQLAIEQLKNEQRIKEFDGLLALFEHEIRLDAGLAAAKTRIENRLREQRYTPDSPADLAQSEGLDRQDVHTLLQVLRVEKKIIRLDDDLFMHADCIEAAQQAVVAFLKKQGKMTVPEFKELVGGASRKFALPLLNYFDAQEITLRQGDLRSPGAAVGED